MFSEKGSVGRQQEMAAGKEKEAVAGVSLRVPHVPQVTHRPHLLLLALVHYRLAGTMPRGCGADAPGALSFHH